MNGAMEIRSLSDARALAEIAVSSGFTQCRRVEEAVMVLLTGNELGLPPGLALRGIYVVSGKPVLSADLMVAVVRRSGLCDTWRTVESTPERCTIVTRRKGEEHESSRTWTMADAKRAGVAGKPIWAQYPATMLRHRCAADLAREVYPDALMGLYDPEELGGEERVAAPPAVATARLAEPQVVHEQPTPAQPAEDLQEVEAEESAPSSRAFATFLDKISTVQALVMVFDLYAALVAGLREEGHAPDDFTAGDDGAGAQARQRIIALGHKLAKAECQQVLLSRALAEILDAQNGIVPGPNALQTAADWWIAHRDAAKERLDAAHRQTPWYALVRRYSGAQTGPDTQRAGKALDAAVKLREKSPPPGGGGGQGPQRASAADAHGDAQTSSGAEGATARTAIEEFRAHLAAIPDRGTDRGAGRIAGAFWKRREGFIEEGTHAEAMGLVIDALHARGVGEPSPWLQQIGEQNGYVQRPRKVA